MAQRGKGGQRRAKVANGAGSGRQGAKGAVGAAGAANGRGKVAARAVRAGLAQYGHGRPGDALVNGIAGRQKEERGGGKGLRRGAPHPHAAGAKGDDGKGARSCVPGAPAAAPAALHAPAVCGAGVAQGVGLGKDGPRGGVAGEVAAAKTPAGLAQVNEVKGPQLRRVAKAKVADGLNAPARHATRGRVGHLPRRSDVVVARAANVGVLGQPDVKARVAPKVAARAK